jgi:hypothetical protein
MRFDKIMRSYFSGEVSTIGEVRPTLWTGVAAEEYAGDGEKYRLAILEQYKIYVEMADRVSARRSLTNTFFLTMNTLVFATVGIFWKDRPAGDPWSLVFPLVALLVQSGAWFWLVRSYRQLNAAKYVVIGALEERLPASPYWRAEWTALAHGQSKERYWRLTHLEQWIPLVFGGLYLVGFLLALLTG